MSEIRGTFSPLFRDLKKKCLMWLKNSKYRVGWWDPMMGGDNSLVLETFHTTASILDLPTDKLIK